VTEPLAGTMRTHRHERSHHSLSRRLRRSSRARRRRPGARPGRSIDRRRRPGVASADPQTGAAGSGRDAATADDAGGTGYGGGTGNDAGAIAGGGGQAGDMTGTLTVG
jgi:hypothetical protein